ncbi:hypothetical protein VTK26DRAFT_138 [Humicola hyalothermophila]
MIGSITDDHGVKELDGARVLAVWRDVHLKVRVEVSLLALERQAQDRVIRLGVGPAKAAAAVLPRERPSGSLHGKCIGARRDRVSTTAGGGSGRLVAGASIAAGLPQVQVHHSLHETVLGSALFRNGTCANQTVQHTRPARAGAWGRPVARHGGLLQCARERRGSRRGIKLARFFCAEKKKKTRSEAT